MAATPRPSSLSQTVRQAGRLSRATGLLHGTPARKKTAWATWRRLADSNSRPYLDDARDRRRAEAAQRLEKRPAATVARLDRVTGSGRRSFHSYFVTHLPSSSLHPDSRSSSGPGHKLPRDASTPHTPEPGSPKFPAASPPNMPSRDLTVVRIPIRRAKHHFGAASSRGTRPYNEDTDQAGTIDMPAFAKRPPISLVHSPIQKPGEATPADSAFGDPQIFYFGIFDGHGGNQCAEFLRDELHGYIEEASVDFGLQSSLRHKKLGSAGQEQVEAQVSRQGDGMDEASCRETDGDGSAQETEPGDMPEGPDRSPSRIVDLPQALKLERDLVAEYKSTVGGYFRRFSPAYFDLSDRNGEATLESVLTYAFLRADLDFISAQARKPDPDDSRAGDSPVNSDEILGAPHQPPSGHSIGGPSRFKGGSTASVALISTPTPAPFWHPASQSTLLVAHVGDTRVLLCETATGIAQPLTSDHHPSTPTESRRLRRYGSMVSADSFGEGRIAGLANSRAFGDLRSKRVGVSAEPEVTRVELGPAQYSFLVLTTDGVSGNLSDQEIVDVIKEARTPEQGANKVVEYATEVTKDGDNATCLVVRLGGWERRSEGGLGSLGTKEMRDLRRAEALDPRRGKR